MLDSTWRNPGPRWRPDCTTSPQFQMPLSGLQGMFLSKKQNCVSWHTFRHLHGWGEFQHSYLHAFTQRRWWRLDARLLLMDRRTAKDSAREHSVNSDRNSWPSPRRVETMYSYGTRFTSSQTSVGNRKSHTAYLSHYVIKKNSLFDVQGRAMTFCAVLNVMCSSSSLISSLALFPLL